MKKYLSILTLLAMGILLTTSCSSDGSNDDNPTPPVTQETKNYVTIGNAAYNEGTMPQATSAATTNAQVASTVQAGGTSVIRVVKDRAYTKFYICVKGMSGYWVYTPTTRTSRAASDDDDFIDIPFNAGSNATGSVTLQISGETESGEVTQPYEQTINYTERASVKGMTVTATGNGTITVMSTSYNQEGLLDSWYSYSMMGFLKFNYSGSTISSITGDEGIRYSVTQNSQGCITQMRGDDNDGYTENWMLTYNDQNRLTRYHVDCNDDGERFTVEARLTWDGGKLTRLDYSHSEEGSTSWTYNYDGEYVNGTQQPFVILAEHEYFYNYAGHSDILGYDIFLPMGTGVFGKGTDMLPVSATSGNSKYEFSYAFNTDGSIKTQTITNGSQTVELKYTY